jgi:L-lactate dehydrogenase complex protein LldF
MAGWAWTMAGRGRYQLAQRLSALGTRLLGRDGRLRWLPPPLDRWTRRRDFPVFATATFRDRWRKRQAGRPRPPRGQPE